MRQSRLAQKLFIDNIFDDLELSYADYQKFCNDMENSTAIYKGKLIDYLYQPVFFDNDDWKFFESLTTKMMNIIEKCVKQYFRDPDFKKLFNFSSSMQTLIDYDPGYDVPVPISRMDIFYKDINDFKFCELNGDGSSAMNEANSLENIFLRTRSSKLLENTFNLSGKELFYSWVDEVLDIYYHKFQGKKESPYIVIADFEGLGTVQEFKIFKKAFNSKGLDCDIVDLRELDYKNNRLFYQNREVDIIYRRAVNREVEKRLEEVSNFIKAYREGVVCVIGPFRSQIMHDKIFFEILSNPQKTHFLSDEDRKFIDNHIPKTKILSQDVLQNVILNKDFWVLKPRDLYAAKGVYIGVDHSHEEWINILENINHYDSYLIQEFCIPPRRKSLVFQGHKATLKEYNTTLGLFVYNRKLKGTYSRTATTNIIADRAEAVILPNIFVSKKNI